MARKHIEDSSNSNVFVAIPFSCYANINRFADGSDDFISVDNVQIEPYVYELIYSYNPHFGYASYILLQCDSMKFTCDKKYSFDVSLGTQYEEFGNLELARQVRVLQEFDGAIRVAFEDQTFFVFRIS